MAAEREKAHGGKRFLIQIKAPLLSHIVASRAPQWLSTHIPSRQTAASTRKPSLLIHFLNIWTIAELFFPSSLFPAFISCSYSSIAVASPSFDWPRYPPLP